MIAEPDPILSTDYINHFAEVAMMLELFEQDDGFARDIRDWIPLTYVDHFKRSPLPDAPAMLRDHARMPHEIRCELARLSDDPHRLILSLQMALQDEHSAACPVALCRVTHEALLALIARISDFLAANGQSGHGRVDERAPDERGQDAIDAMFASA